MAELVWWALQSQSAANRGEHMGLRRPADRVLPALGDLAGMSGP